MSGENNTIPKPTPVDELPPPEMPPHLKPHPPGPMRITTLITDAGPELACILKRTYALKEEEGLELADVQPPLDETGEFHEELEPGKPAAYKSLPEIIGFKTGTDVIVQASAHSPFPTPEMIVSVNIGQYKHQLKVSGRRYCDFKNGSVVFTPPEPFEELPLRYENAYGGKDDRFEKALVESVENEANPDKLRRVKAAAGGILGKVNPLVYPRNRFGKGYILEEQKAFIEGRELPNIELEDDLLAPERLVVGHPLDWMKQPVPAGFDFLEPLAFPRSAMLGMPPMFRGNLNECFEVGRKYIPSDFYKGNLYAGSFAELPDLIHPSAGRCASIGLWLPFMKGNELLILSGMSKAKPHSAFQLPAEKPEFNLQHQHVKEKRITTQLYQVVIDAEQKTVSMIWVGRSPITKPISTETMLALEAELTYKMEKI